MIKTVISMMLVCAIMVQSEETITGVTCVICPLAKDCKEGTSMFAKCDTKTLTTLDVESCTDRKIKVCDDEGKNCVEYENGVCTNDFLGSASYTWTGGCGKSGSIEPCSVSNTVATEKSCDCSGKTCTSAQFCYDNVCNKAKKACSVSNTVGDKVILVAPGKSCDCSGKTCTSGQFCYDDFCNSKANANSNAKVATTVLFSMLAILFL